MTRVEFSRTVKMATWDRAGGCCEECGRKLFPGDRKEYDHRIPDAIRKDNGAENCQLLCGPCHSAKTKKDRKQIAKANRVRAKHNGAKQTKHPLPGSKASGWKRKVSGEVVRRDEDDDILGDWL